MCPYPRNKGAKIYIFLYLCNPVLKDGAFLHNRISNMNKILPFFLALCAFCAFPAFAQAASGPDDILGEYYVEQNGEQSRVRFSKADDGTFQAHVFWVKNDLDKQGKKRLDEKNPNRSLRNVPCDQILLVWNMNFNPEKGQWSGGKVYDPTRGIRANAVCWFEDETHLKLKGSLLGISETVVWVKEK